MAFLLSRSVSIIPKMTGYSTSRNMAILLSRSVSIIPKMSGYSTSRNMAILLSRSVSIIPKMSGYSTSRNVNVGVVTVRFQHLTAANFFTAPPSHKDLPTPAKEGWFTRLPNTNGGCNSIVSVLPKKQTSHDNGGGKNTSTYGWEFGSLFTSLFTSLVAVGLSFVGGCIGMHYDHQRKLTAIDNVIKAGSCPSVNINDIWKIERKELLEDITDTFIKDSRAQKLKVTNDKPENLGATDEQTYFGIIWGPTGTGKTQLIREACCKSGEGALYFEMYSSELDPKEFAEALGIITEPRFFNVFLNKFLPSYVGHFSLPEGNSGLFYVIQILEERAKEFKSKTGRPVSLFIDGVDKYDKKAFGDLLTCAKTLAVNGNLRIVFICSEGHIIPLINTMSLKSVVRMKEILDLPYDDGVEYLRSRVLPVELAKRVIDFAGSRIIFLNRAGDTFFDCLHRNILDEDEQFLAIIRDLLGVSLGQSIDTIITNRPISIKILKHLKQFDDETGFHLYQYLNDCDKNGETKYKEVLQKLIEGDVLRYTFKNKSPLDKTLNVTWHNQVIKNEAIKLFKL